MQKKTKMVKPRDIAGNEEEKEEGEAQGYIVGKSRRKIRMVKPRDIAGNAEEEECESSNK